MSVNCFSFAETIDQHALFLNGERFTEMANYRRIMPETEFAMTQCSDDPPTALKNGC
jgi:hypothetical protein